MQLFINWSAFIVQKLIYMYIDELIIDTRKERYEDIQKTCNTYSNL